MASWNNIQCYPAFLPSSNENSVGKSVMGSYCSWVDIQLASTDKLKLPCLIMTEKWIKFQLGWQPISLFCMQFNKHKYT